MKIGLVPAAVVALVVSGGAPAAKAERKCPVTHPNGNSPKESPGSKMAPRDLDSFNYGNGALWIALYWQRGTIVASPDGSSEAIIAPDGSVQVKVGWYRGVSGKLTLTGRRLGTSAPPLRAHMPDGYTPFGFQPTGIVFPTVGCWRVTGRVGRRASLTFVVRVVER